MKKIDYSKLNDEFSSKDIEWRIDQSFVKDGAVSAAKAFAYVTNRAIQKRLDDVCGQNGWRNEFKPIDGGELCGISIYDSEKQEWITKWDGAQNTNYESIKGGLSNSMKRAAVQWGIGRYLYNLSSKWVQIAANKQKGWNRAVHVDRGGARAKRITFYWQTPTLPKWALPEDEKKDSLDHIIPEPENLNYKNELKSLNQSGVKGGPAGHRCEICGDPTTQEMAKQTEKYYRMKMCDPCAQAAKPHYKKRKMVGIEEVSAIKKDRGIK